jgi:hypothetical protein
MGAILLRITGIVGGGAAGRYARSDLGLEKSLLPKGRRALDNLKIPLPNRKPEEPLRFVLCKLSVSSTGQTIEGSFITGVFHPESSVSKYFAHVRSETDVNDPRLHFVKPLPLQDSEVSISNRVYMKVIKCRLYSRSLASEEFDKLPWGHVRGVMPGRSTAQTSSDRKMQIPIDSSHISLSFCRLPLFLFSFLSLSQNPYSEGQCLSIKVVRRTDIRHVFQNRQPLSPWPAPHHSHNRRLLLWISPLWLL